MSEASASRLPTIIVIDASMALAWVFERHQPIDRDRANRLLAACGEVPCWWPSGDLYCPRPIAIASSAG